MAEVKRKAKFTPSIPTRDEENPWYGSMSFSLIQHQFPVAGLGEGVDVTCLELSQKITQNASDDLTGLVGQFATPRSHEFLGTNLP